MRLWGMGAARMAQETGSDRPMIIGLGLALIAALALLVFVILNGGFPGFEAPGEDEAATATAPATGAPPETRAAPPAEPETPPASEAAEAPETADAPAPPRFDVVRVDALGSAVVAGEAEPGGLVQVGVDAEVMAETRADGAGKFVALFDIAPSNRPRVVTLTLILPDGARLRSSETVILAPSEPELAAADAPSVGTPARVAEEPAAEALRESPAAAAEADAAGSMAAAPAADAGAPGDTAAGAPAPAAETVAGETGTAEPPDAPTAAAGTETGEAIVAAGDAAEGGETVSGDVGTATEGSEPAVAAEAPAVAETSGAGASAPAESGPAVMAEAPAAAESAAAGSGDEAAPAVPAPRAPTVLLATDEGVRVLQPSGDAGPVDTVRIDTIAYDAEGAVRLSGRGVSGSFARVYVDNAPVATVPIGEDGGWSTGLPGVAAGVYTLRVDEVDAAGAVTSRIETPFQREAAEDVLRAAEAAELPAPTDGAEPVPDLPRVTLVTVQPGFTLWGISERTYGEGVEYVRIYEANRDQIRDPDLIYPGQIFELPER